MADLRTYQPAFTAGVLSPALWARVDLAKYPTGLRQGKNIFVHPHGGASNRAGFKFVGEVKSSSQKTDLIPFQFNTEQSYMLEVGHLYMRVYRDGGAVLSGGSIYETATPYTEDQVGSLVFTQEADVMYITHEDHSPRKLSRLADDNWALTAVTFAPAMAAPGGVSASVVSGSGTKTYKYKVAAVSASTGEESLPSAEASVQNDLAIAGGKNRVSWSAVAGASRYIVYKDNNGVYGYIGGTSGTSFDDENIVADLADGPQSGHNPFNGAGNYPRCVSFVEQRLAFASSKNNPQACWMSQTANYENFGFSSPAKASDAVTFRIRARQVNEIRSLLPMRGMMLLTSGAEWIVSGGSQSDAITPSAVKIDNQGYRGAARVQPVVVGNTVLFPQDRGGVIRDFSYEFAQDSFVGRDLTILARHFFEGRSIKSWGYAQAPWSMVWVVLDNGKLLSLTYMKEHEVWAWTEHESDDGIFESVAVISEDQEDVPYFVVRRTVNGVQRRYIERLHSRNFSDVQDAFFVDSGLTYVGTPSTVISGLGHLEGKQVVALANGNVVRNLTVSGGSVTLPNPVTQAHIGLPITSMLETLSLDLGAVQGLGTVQGRTKSVSEVTLRVENTRGVFVGPYDGDRDSPHLVEYKQRQTEAWNEAIKMYTGDIHITPAWDWNERGSIVVKQFDPLPMTILALMPDVSIGR